MGKGSIAMSSRPRPNAATLLERLEPGRVVLAVPDGWNGGLVVDYFRSQVWGCEGYLCL